MRRALAALLGVCALAAQAQTPPDSPPERSPQEVPAPDQPSDAQPAPGVVTQEQAEEPRAPPPPRPVRTPVARAQAVLPPAPAAAAPQRPAPEYEQQLQQLRTEVSRLQSELDAERAAALAATEELSGVRPARGPWGSLAVAAVLALAAGFLLGWRVLDLRIRRKYGGLRIY